MSDQEETKGDSATQMINTAAQQEQEVENGDAPVIDKAGDSDEEQMMEDDEMAMKIDKFEKFSINFARAVAIQVEDVGANDNHRQKFLDVLEDCFSNIIRLSNSVTACQNGASILKNSFVVQIGTKAVSIAESTAQSQNLQEENQEVIDKAGKAETKKLMEEVIEVYANQLTVWRKNADCGKTTHQAGALISLAVDLRSATKEKLGQSSKLTDSVLWLGDSMLNIKNAPKQKVMQKLAKSVYLDLIKGEADSKAKLLEKDNTMFSTLMLGFLLGDMPNDSEIIDCLSERSNNVVFSDKSLTALSDVQFFQSFFENASEETLVQKILPAAQVACRRQESFIKNVVFMVKSLKAFKLSAETAQQLIPDMLTVENLWKRDSVVKALLTNVCSQLDREDYAAFETKVLRDFMLKNATDTIADSTIDFDKKVRVIEAAFDCILVLIQKDTSNDQQVAQFFKDASQVFLTLLFSKNEEIKLQDSVYKVFQQFQSEDVLSFIQTNATKIVSTTQVNFVVSIFPSSPTEAWQNSVGDAVKSTLLTLNYQSTANYGQILSMMALLRKMNKFVTLFNSESQVSQYLSNGASVVGSTSFCSKLPGFDDVSNHLNLIGDLLYNEEVPLTKSQTRNLTRSLFEYASNEVYTFRANSVYNAFRGIAKRGGQEAILTLIEAFMVKQSEISDRPQAKSVNEDGKKEQNTELKSRTVNCVSILIEALVETGAELNFDQFTLILQTLCHPMASPDQRSLKKSFQFLQKTFTEEKFCAMFDQHSDAIIEQFLKQRSGILSENLRVRQIAKNILIFFSWTGFMEKLLPEMTPIFQYKPIQMLNKMEYLLKQEFDSMSHYDLMFYSEISKDLLKVFGTKDVVTVKKALREPDEQPVEEEKKEEIKTEEPVVKVDLTKPIDFAAMMKAKKANKGKDKKKGKKASKAKAPSKPAAATAPVVEKPAAPVQTKEERNKEDRQQLMTYVEKLRQIKATHVAICQEILLVGNQCDVAERLNYQDKTLNYTINSLTKLLNLAATRWSSQMFLDNLLNTNSDLPFFKIKSSIVTCFMAIAQDRLTPRTTQEFQNCLVFLDETANFGHMEGGYLKLTLTIANYVLKDPSVNLSVKEIGLQVTQNILDSNSEVETIDIVRLTINMLKTNYISSNLAMFIRKLMQRCSRIEIAMLLQRLFQYQPVPRKTLLQEILNHDEPLFSPVWLQTQLWVLLSDEELSSLARKIWNKFGIYLQPEALSIAREKEDMNMFHYLRSPNFSIFDLTVQATAAAIELLQFTESSQFVYDLIQFYDDEWKIIQKQSFEAVEDDYTKDQEVQMGLIGDDRVNRIAIPKIFKLTARFVKQQDHEAVLTFLVTKACLDQNEDINEAAQEAANEFILIQGPKHANSLLVVLESFVKDSGAPSDVKNQACILLAKLAPYLNDTSAKKIQATVEKLFELSMSTRSEQVRQSICKCIPQLSRYIQEKAKIYVKEQLALLSESSDEGSLKGSAYNVAGLFKAQGMKVLQEMDVLNTFGGSYFLTKRSDYVRKLAALNLFETLSFSMGRTFELYLDIVFPHILSSISDQREVVREAATNALKRIMANFSNYAIKQALPQFLNQLETDNWRSKISTVEALGNMAYCAPKQISGFLPQIVKGLREVMNDTHEKVHDSAIQAISKIGSVIKCPEVGDMLEIIIKALANTQKHLKEALNLLLETSFVHKIDAPSLSLLVPLLDSGLMMHDNKAKSMAAQLMGNICSLTSDASDLLPYMSILMPAIKNSLFDPIPEIRASSAKAMGSLSKGLGVENSLEMLGWLREFLNNTTIQTNERLGSAQGFAELISSHGTEYFEVNVEEVIIKAKDQDGDIREAYRSVMLYLANSFDGFGDYLPKLVPLMIQGLADEKDEVRKVSMRNVKICIKVFGKNCPNQLVMPIMRMMFSHDSRVRASSSILMYSLVKELENDIIKAQPKYIDMDTKHKILSSMFILRSDPIETVKGQAGQIWKSIVDNQLFIIRQVVDTLVALVFQIIQSPSNELQEMGLACMRSLVEKFGEKLVTKALDIFERLLDTVTESSQTVGICQVMYHMVSAAAHRLLATISPRIISIMEGYLSSTDEKVRDWATKVFVTMFQRQPDKAFIDQNLERCILYKLRMFNLENKKEESERLILSLKSMVISAKDLRIQDKLLRLCEISKRDQPFSIAQAQVLGALAPTISSQVFHKRLYTAVMTSLEEELNAEVIDDKNRIHYVLMAYAQLMSHIPQNDFTDLTETMAAFSQNMREKDRPELYIDFIGHFCANTRVDIEKLAIDYLENVLRYMNHPEREVIEKVINAMSAIIKKVSKETQFAFVPRIRESIEQVCVKFVGMGSPLLEHPLEHRYQRKVPHLALLSFPAGVKCIVEVAQAAIMHGSIQVRTDAAYCFKYLLDFAPELGKGEIVKICGALIRVANDRFPQELKLQNYFALRYIQTKGGPSAKGFNVNMQTTYTKAIGDPAATLPSRRIVLENLVLLVASLPRIDPIVKDLNALVDGTKIDGDQKTSVSECLSLIIRLKGKAISSAISQQIYKTITDILGDRHGATNDRIYANCATALAFLSAYASDASQMQALFTAFDDNEIDAIMLPLKFAILINGNETIDKASMVKDFSSLLVQRLTDSAGFEEIDDETTPIDTENEDECFRFKGVLDTLAFTLDKFARREMCQKADSTYMKMVYQCLNTSTVFKRLAEEDSIGLDSYKLLCNFASLIPIKTGADGSLTAECAEMTRDILACMQKFYLDHWGVALQDSQDALLNILQLNYDNYIDYSNDCVIQPLTKPNVKVALDASHLVGVMLDDMKLYAVDILFKKKF